MTFQKAKDVAPVIKLINKNEYIICQHCNKKTKGRYEYRQAIYISDHMPRHLTLCRMCIYKEAFGRKNYSKKMKANVIENSN